MGCLGSKNPSVQPGVWLRDRFFMMGKKKMKTSLLRLILHQLRHRWPSPHAPHLSINTPPSLHCFSGGWRHSAGSCQGLLQQKCDELSLPCCRETSTAASSQPIALINDSAPHSPFQQETGGSHAVNPNLKAGPTHSFRKAQTWLLGSPGSSPQALRHCLGRRWPGLGGCDAQRSPASDACSPACCAFPEG